jgi:iron(III) transport system permease protein
MIRHLLHQSKFAKASTRPVLAFLAAGLISLPLLAIVWRTDWGASEAWDHYREFLLADAIGKTLQLVLLTGLIAGAIGVALAIIMVFFDFPGRKVLSWLLYIPLALPPYLAAYVYSGLLGYTGFVQRALRALEIPVQPVSLNIMTLPGAALIYSLTLFPYVYGPVSAFLSRHSASLVESARVLGLGPGAIVWRVILPLIRLPLTGGLMLLMMEVISDYGVVQYFNLSTVSSLIFRSWFGMGETTVASRLSLGLMVSVLFILVLESALRGRRKFHTGSGKNRPVEPVKLPVFWQGIVIGLIGIILVLAIVGPVIQLIHWAILSWPRLQSLQLGIMVRNSVGISLLAGLIIILLSLFLAHTQRFLHGTAHQVLGKLVQLGYSMPGAIIAIGVISLFVTLDQSLQPLYQRILAEPRSLVLSTSLVMLIFAMVVRYLAVGFNPIQSGFAKIGSKFSEAAQTLGRSKFQALLQIELPLIRSSLLSGLILAYIDISKELPLTLLLRPFNFNTLASKAYEYANDERIHQAAIPALVLISINLAGLWLLIRLQKKQNPR